MVLRQSDISILFNITPPEDICGACQSAPSQTHFSLQLQWSLLLNLNSIYERTDF